MSRLRPVVMALAATLMLAGPARADLFKVDRFTATGDFRFRSETDWDSQDGGGTPRADRTRLRVRLRVGLRFDPNEHWRLEARLRSGAEESQQSPHVTILDFDDNDTGDAAFNLDRWYVQGRTGGLSAWVGRNGLPFWKQNELLFDDDVSMAGAAATWEDEVGPGALTLTGGYFSPPVGMRQFAGNMLGGQVSYRPELGGLRWAFALGGYRFDANPGDPDAGLLQQGNGRRDYGIVAASAQAQWSIREVPLAVGADLLHNAEEYSPSDPDPVTAANHDETDGYVLQVTYGRLASRGQWLAGYSYARIETLAVNSSFAQDDWVRWGTATQTRGSNMKGHELRFGWAFDPRVNLLARVYLADSITTVEDGKRFRVDVNWTF